MKQYKLSTDVILRISKLTFSVDLECKFFVDNGGYMNCTDINWQIDGLVKWENEFENMIINAAENYVADNYENLIDISIEV